MELFAIPGSVRAGSYNLALLRAMAQRATDGTNVEIFDGLEEIPIFNPDVADKDIPEVVKNFTSKIRESDGVVISTPEYAHGVPGVLKNALDWLVSSDALVLKPVVVTSVSTSGLGGMRSHAPLVLILSAMNTNVVIEGSLNVPYAHRKFDDDLELMDEFTESAVSLSLRALEQAINRSRE